MRHRRLTPRSVAVLVSVGAHLLAFVVLLNLHAPPAPPERSPVRLTLAAPSPLKRAAAPVLAEAAAVGEPSRAVRAPMRRLRRPDLSPVAATSEAIFADDGGVADADLAGLFGDGEGSGPGAETGGCDLTAALRKALRQDPLVQAAVAQLPARRSEGVVRVWNGDWLAHPGQEGRGLAAVREAILWEVGFATARCRDQPIHGVVVISTSDDPAALRLALGSGQWRWADLLSLHGSPDISPTGR